VKPFSILLNFFRSGNFQVKGVEKIFFGIGNPGLQYADTRHNAGFMAIDLFAKSFKKISSHRFDSWDIDIVMLDKHVIGLVKPKTFVNLCGNAFSSVIDKVGCQVSSCLVIVDDYNLPLGAIRLRSKGSDGGHNGLKSIIANVGDEFPRLRIGIGPLPENVKTVDFVLDKFGLEERQNLQEALLKSRSVMETYISRGINAAMNAYNK
jgi:PTH1 family peptidyl-tRNA hydrolase